MALTPPGSAIFVDTNILVYASFPASPFHDAARIRLKELENAGSVFWTSRQVLREYLAAMTRPGAVIPAPELTSLLQAVRQFEAEFLIADEDAGVTAHLLDLVEAQAVKGKQVHDANIVASMLRQNIRHLLTHNTADFARCAPEISVLPLLP